jgi:hypothetical protein
MKKLALTIAITTLLLCLNFASAETIAEKKSEENNLLFESNTAQTLTWLQINYLEDPTFSYSYATREYDPNLIIGTFFNIEITGIITTEYSIQCHPLLRFRIFKYKDQNDLGIEIGDTVKITAKMLTTWAPGGSQFGKIRDSGLHINPVVLNLIIEVLN